MIRVLIVEDSSFMRKLLKEIFDKDSRIEVVGQASNGQEALDFLSKNKVDVVTLDIEMPEMDGIEFLKRVNQTGMSIIMISSLTKEGAQITLDALEYGAIDFIEKPENFFSINSKEKSQEIIDKVIAADSIKNDKSKLRYHSMIKRPAKRKVAYKVPAKNLVVIGSSTGGPRALQEVIPHLSADLNAGVVVVQHMPKGFTKSLAARLDKISEIKVKEAEHLDDIYNGYCYIAKGDYHMEVNKKPDSKMQIGLNQDPPDGTLRPSIDKMLYTLKDIPNRNILVVILTGMGKDGTKGLIELKKTKKLTIYSEDESTCVVYGMPRSVEESGLSQKVIKLTDISKEIENYLEGK